MNELVWSDTNIGNVIHSKQEAEERHESEVASFNDLLSSNARSAFVWREMGEEEDESLDDNKDKCSISGRQWSP